MYNDDKFQRPPLVIMCSSVKRFEFDGIHYPNTITDFVFFANQPQTNLHYTLFQRAQSSNPQAPPTKGRTVNEMFLIISYHPSSVFDHINKDIKCHRGTINILFCPLCLTAQSLQW